MKHPRLSLKTLPLALASAAVLSAASQARATPTLRHQAEQRGDFVIFGNTLGFDCRSGIPDPIFGSVNRGACGQNTSDSAIDILWRSDEPVAGDVRTVESVAQARSTAVLTLPPGASVTYARLYWSAGVRTAADVGKTVTLERPGRVSTQLVADRSFVVDSGNTGPGIIYQSTADVTSLVKSLGAGPFRVSGIRAAEIFNVDVEVTQIVWAMVVFYQSATEPPRNLALFDGLSTVMPGTPAVANLTGFLVPTNVGARLGILAYEGDSDAEGDGIQWNGKDLANELNPANNFLNATRSVLGRPVSVVGDLPQMSGLPGSMNGFDLDVVDASGLLKPGDTKATITARTVNDIYFLGAFVTAVETQKPLFDSSRLTIVDLTNPGRFLPGDTIEITLTTRNTGTDDAVDTQFDLTLPPGLTFEPGSIEILSGPGAGLKTDRAYDDQGEFFVGPRTVRIRLGEGADGRKGGAIAQGAGPTSCRFRARINDDAKGKFLLQGFVQAAGKLAAAQGVPPFRFPTSSDVPVRPYFGDGKMTVVDLTVPNRFAPGDTCEHTVAVQNNGSDSGAGVVIEIPIPPNLSYVPGSLRIISAHNPGPKTDSMGDDQGEYDPTARLVRFRCGAGANGRTGGVISPKDPPTVVTFRTTVNPGAMGPFFRPAVVETVGQSSVDGGAGGATTPLRFILPTVLGRQPQFAGARMVVTDLTAPNRFAKGDRLQCDVRARNTGNDDGIGAVLEIPIPVGVTYVPGSLEIVAAHNTGTKSDVPGDDQAEYDPGVRAVRFRLGLGANARVGGRLSPADPPAQVRFQVTLDADARPDSPATALRPGVLEVGGFIGQAAGLPLLRFTVPPVLGDQPDFGGLKMVVTDETAPDRYAPGDTLRYTVTAPNSGKDEGGRTSLEIPLPPGVSYVPGSLRVVSGPNEGAKTDGAGDDQGEYDVGGRRVVCRLGTGADGARGGSIKPGEPPSVVEFKAVIDTPMAGAPTGRLVVPGILLTSGRLGLGLGLPPLRFQTEIEVPKRPQVRTTMTITDLTMAGRFAPGDTLEYTVNLQNSGTDNAEGSVVAVRIPQEWEYIPETLEYSGGDLQGAKTDAAGDDAAEYDGSFRAVRCRIGAGATATAGGTLRAGGQATVKFRVRILPGVAGRLLSRATSECTGKSAAGLGLAPHRTVTVVETTVPGGPSGPYTGPESPLDLGDSTNPANPYDGRDGTPAGGGGGLPGDEGGGGLGGGLGGGGGDEPGTGTPGGFAIKECDSGAQCAGRPGGPQCIEQLHCGCTSDGDCPDTGCDPLALQCRFPTADLRLDVAVSGDADGDLIPDEKLGLDPVRYAARVTNLGPGTSPEQRVTFSVPATSKVQTLTPGEGWSCQAKGVLITCVHGQALTTTAFTSEILVTISPPAEADAVVTIDAGSDRSIDPAVDNNLAISDLSQGVTLRAAGGGLGCTCDVAQDRSGPAAPAALLGLLLGLALLRRRLWSRT